MEIYNKPKSNQLQEKLFQTYLLTNFRKFQHVNKTYTLFEDEFLNPLLDVRKVEKALIIDNSLSYKKKISVLQILSNLPDKVRVAEKCNLVSVDFLIIDSQNQKKYIEFHEIQHRTLTVNRLTPVYDDQFNRYEIPRFVQRILKDIWRFENLPNYKIVWFDWFAANPSYNVAKLLFSEVNEFAIEGRFAFHKLLQLPNNDGLRILSKF